jgi:alkanesulfonate monooxygenase SsuD/methylene tetrahydromethanopterin reductase-like flavin-dependent oxidoreductase (luciferase family)
MPSRTAPLEDIPRYARRAEDYGLDSVWSYELHRNPFSMLALAASATRSITLGVGVAAAFVRTPMAFANAAVDIDELSGGRAIFGIGAGDGGLVRALHGQPYDHPVARMREYVTCLRRSWQYLASGTAEPFNGQHYRFTPLDADPWGVRVGARGNLPVYLGAMRPSMISLCGEIADGWCGFLSTPRFIEEFVLPRLEIGWNKAARTGDGFETVAEVITSVHPDRDVAMRRAKIQVGFYVSSRFADLPCQLHGVVEQQARLRAALRSRGPAALADTDESLVEVFAIAGTPTEARERLSEYEGVGHLVFHTPYVPPLTAEESADAYMNTLTAFGSQGALHMTSDIK